MNRLRLRVVCAADKYTVNELRILAAAKSFTGCRKLSRLTKYTVGKV